jgi:hypothetical protein
MDTVKFDVIICVVVTVKKKRKFGNEKHWVKHPRACAHKEASNAFYPVP